MAVRANDIALLDLGQQTGDARVADHPGNGRRLRARVPMIEVHAALREQAAAVRTRNRPKLIEDVSVVSPALSLLGNARVPRDRQVPLGQPLAMLTTTTQSVAVRAHDIALRDFREQALAIHQLRPAGHQVEGLCRRIPMIKVHLDGLKLPSAVGARNCAKRAKELRGRSLTATNALDFLLPIRGVVADVGRALT
jgi:hypothetical protein